MAVFGVQTSGSLFVWLLLLFLWARIPESAPAGILDPSPNYPPFQGQIEGHGDERSGTEISRDGGEGFSWDEKTELCCRTQLTCTGFHVRSPLKEAAASLVLKKARSYGDGKAKGDLVSSHAGERR